MRVQAEVVDSGNWKSQPHLRNLPSQVAYHRRRAILLPSLRLESPGIDTGAFLHILLTPLAALAAYGHWAILAGYLPEGRNLVQGVRKVPAVGSAPRWLSRAERSALLRAVEAEVERAMLRYPRLQVQVRRDATITLLLLNTGLRLGEVQQLNVGDVRLDERRGKVVVRQGKGGKYREVPLNACQFAHVNVPVDFGNDVPPDFTQNAPAVNKSSRTETRLHHGGHGHPCKSSACVSGWL